MIAADCCAIADEAFHSILLNNLMPPHAKAQIVDELIKK